MKKITLGILTLLFSLTVFAHDLNLGCWNNGRFTINVTKVTAGSTAEVKITGTTYDTLIHITGTTFSFTVPQPNINTHVTVTVHFSDGFNTSIVTSSVSCKVLPLKFASFTIKQISKDSLQAFIEVYEVINVRQININWSRKGIPQQTIAIILPDNINEIKQYSVKFKIPKK